MLSLPRTGVLRLMTWFLALVCLVYSGVPIIYGLLGAPIGFLISGLALLAIGLVLLTRLAPGKPLLWLGVLMVVYGFPLLFSAVLIGLPVVAIGGVLWVASARDMASSRRA